jgi:ABC-type branched-subunit amino acid transport system substrate-binding protein
VNGRKIEFIAKDDGYNPTNTSSVTNDLVLKEEVFAMVGRSDAYLRTRAARRGGGPSRSARGAA